MSVRKGIPQGRYTKEFREEAVKMVIEGKMPSHQAAGQLSLPPSTLENWVKAYKAGKLGDVGKTYRPLTEIEMELARTKRELAEVKMEREILKNCHKGGAFSCNNRNLSGYTIGRRRGRLLSGVFFTR